MRYAEVVVDAPFNEGEVFDYLIPNELLSTLFVGSRVLVPFGKRKIEGYVIKRKLKTELINIREIIEVLDEEPPLNEELIELAKFISDRYLSPLFITLQAMVPASLRSKYVKVIAWNEEYDHMPLIVLPEEEEILNFINKNKEVEYKTLLKLFTQVSSVLEHFIEKKYLLEKTMIKDEKEQKYEKIVSLLIPSQNIDKIIETLPHRATKIKQLLMYLQENPTISMKILLNHVKANYSHIKRLVELNLITIYDQLARRNPYQQTYIPDSSQILTHEQQLVFDKVLTSIQQAEVKSYLLHGVTGSGKTEIYLQVIQHVLTSGKEGIMLVPEISLTPLMVERFKKRFGDQIAVLHSGLSAGEKLDEWIRIRKGEAKIVVGARSAIFAPMKKIGVIIIDEEHESTYKQEEQPRYHVREVAIRRAQLHQAVVLFGSATPSLESYAFARAGRFELLELKNRVNDQSLPFVHLVDLREELREGHRHLFSRILLDKIKEKLNQKEQIVLLLNRRGYSTVVICRSCGYTAECPHCDITLTYHQSDHSVKCHYCGYMNQLETQCPNCKSEHLRYLGIGTQRVEEELVKQFPGIRVIRMDTDTTSRKGAHERLLSAFGNYEADVLLGTQMIAKGLDFPRVSLVGMISADTMLHLADFRAAERTFQLITQVAGRAGRHEIPGEVVVQTYTPEHYSIELAVKQDYIEFFNHEIRLRKQNQYPPFYRLCLIHFTHEESSILIKVMNKFAEELRSKLSTNSVLFGPVPSSVQRIKDRYRYHCMVKYKDEANLNQLIRNAINQCHDLVMKHKIQVSIDIDPQYLQ